MIFRRALLPLALMTTFSSQLADGCLFPPPPPEGMIVLRVLLPLSLLTFSSQFVDGCIAPPPPQTSPPDGGRRNLVENDQTRLLELNELTLIEDETLWQQNKFKCASEMYDVSLFIYHHLAAVASPVDPNSECLPITFDVLSDGKKLSTHKRVVPDKSVIKKDYLVKSSMLKIDERKFSQIAEAFELMVHLGPSDNNYDVMDNNCATYLFEAGKLLNITPMKYPKIAHFTKKRLRETGTYIMEAVRNHPDASFHFDGATGEEISDDAALEVVVQYNIDKHAEENTPKVST